MKNHKTSQPEITIIIPAFNSDRTIHRCLNSIKKQTFANFEAIVINDGSTDNTVDKIKQSISSDHRFKLINQTNMGVSVARNAGLKKAKGNYICFVDSDDTIQPNFLEKLYSAIISNKADLAICNMNFVYGNHINRPIKAPFRILDRTQYARALVEGIEGYLCCRLYHNSVIRNLYFQPNISYQEDFLFNVEALEKIHKVVTIEDFLYNYTQTGTSASTQNNLHRITALEADKKILHIIKQLYPKLVPLYATQFLTTTYRFKHELRDLKKTHPEAYQKIHYYCTYFKPYASVRHKIKFKTRIKFFGYKYCFRLMETLRRIKHSVGGSSDA